MFGVGNGVPYMSPEQYNQMLQSMMMQNNNRNINYLNNMNANRNQNGMQVLQGRPVSSMEEARASMIDMDGSLFMFPDFANRMIYTKQINLNGEPEFKTYVLKEEPKQNKVEEQNITESQYVLKDDFEKIVSGLIQKIKVLEEKKNVADFSTDGKPDDAEQSNVPKGR